MSVCEAFSDAGDGTCMWCLRLKGEHRAGDCPDCLGYGYVYGDGLTADGWAHTSGRPTVCGRCEGACFIGRDGRPALL